MRSAGWLFNPLLASSVCQGLERDSGPGRALFPYVFLAVCCAAAVAAESRIAPRPVKKKGP